MESSSSFAKPTNKCHLTGFWARLFQSRPSIPSDLVPISQLCFHLRKRRFTGIIPTGFQTKFCLRTYHFPMCKTYPLHLLFTGFITLPQHYTDSTSYASRSSGYPFYRPTKHNSEMPVPFCEHFFVVIASPESGWNKPLNTHDTPLLQVTRYNFSDFL